MIINESTGEIAYHCLILKKEGGLEFHQNKLKHKNKKDKITFLSPLDLEKLDNK